MLHPPYAEKTQGTAISPSSSMVRARPHPGRSPPRIWGSGLRVTLLRHSAHTPRIVLL